MESGSIPVEEFSGGVDVQATLESGQTFCWRREDDRMYETVGPSGGSAWYSTVVGGHTDDDPDVVRIRQRDGLVEWEATTDADSLVVERLRLDDDLPAIFEELPDGELLGSAIDAYRGLRIVDDPFFPCLISFICSAQMRVERIHEMQTALASEFGEEIAFDGETYHAYPTPDRLARASEDDLRELGLGYRAPYVERSAELVSSGEATADDVRGLDYADAREEIQAFVGVGDKVADCVLLFSLGYLEAVPLDTWIRTAIGEYYPHCEQGSYDDTSAAIREEFGGEYAGYAQTYVFHYLRNRE
jgi:N-glycosylase/DNA lyase